MASITWLAEPIAAVTGGTLRKSAASTSVMTRPPPTRRGDTARRFSLIAQANAISATTPKADEGRLASPCNIFAKAIGDVKALAKVRAGSQIRVTALG